MLMQVDNPSPQGRTVVLCTKVARYSFIGCIGPLIAIIACALRPQDAIPQARADRFDRKIISVFFTKPLMRPSSPSCSSSARPSSQELQYPSSSALCRCFHSTPMSALQFPPVSSRDVHVPGGKLCFSLSAFSESFKTNVYRKR